MQDRKGDWMQTRTGVQFWPLDPRPEDVHLEDIAWSLSNQCRYAGHCAFFYSVAQHSVMVADMVPDELKRVALLHDATEAYLVDLPRPVKRRMADYRAAEQVVWEAIAQRFGLPLEMPAAVKDADEDALATEAPILMPNAPRSWNLRGAARPFLVHPMSPEGAYAAFMRTAELVGLLVARPVSPLEATTEAQGVA